MESELACKVEGLFKILNDENYNDRLRHMYTTGEWEHLSVYLMLHLTLVMIRTPKCKEIIFNKDKLPLEIKQVFYKEFLFGKEEAKMLASKQFQDRELDIMSKVIEKNSDFNGGINVLMNYLVNNYYIEIYKAPVKKKFFLSDNPIIVNQKEGIDYFMPLSSNFAIVMKKISWTQQFKISILQTASEKMVDGVNKMIIGNSTRIIIVENMTSKEFEFIIGNIKK